jgi:hypothetical protein
VCFVEEAEAMSLMAAGQATAVLQQPVHPGVFPGSAPWSGAAGPGTVSVTESASLGSRSMDGSWHVGAYHGMHPMVQHARMPGGASPGGSLPSAAVSTEPVASPDRTQAAAQQFGGHSLVRSSGGHEVAWDPVVGQWVLV